MLNPEWIDHPIDCERVANLAGAHYKDERVGQGPIRYCRTHFMVDNIPELEKGPPCVLITSGSDASVMREDVRRLPENVRQWFSTNVMVQDQRVLSLPIGFIFNHPRFLMIRAEWEKGPIPRVNLMYTNFTRNGIALRGVRDGLYEEFGKYSWNTTKGGSSYNDVAPEEFYHDLHSHFFTLSPPGAGPDCHRSWEALALGSIPIVLRSQAMRIFDDLPVLQVDSWAEVTPGRLESSIKILTPRFETEAMRKLGLKYWEEKIKSWV